MDLLNIEEKYEMTREDAAAVLRQIADSLARHNNLEFTRDGLRFTVDVADSVEVEIELEIEDDGSSLEIEINW
jgi:amphi-Trp domain-containing protein